MDDFSTQIQSDEVESFYEDKVEYGFGGVVTDLDLEDAVPF
jgi:hypothetical protein